MCANAYSLGFQNSKIDQDIKSFNVKIIEKQQEYLRQMLASNVKETLAVDENGFAIMNANEENMWFATNVIFIFGKGAVYDEDDDKIFGTIMDTFYNEFHGKAFLINKFFIEDYRTSSIIKGLEKTLYITPGNYHICLIPIVIEGADVKGAPEKMYRKVGIVDKFMEWETINEYLYVTIGRYGFYTDPRNNPKEELHPLIQEGFNFDESMNLDYVKEIENNLRRDSNLDIKRNTITNTGRDGVNLSTSKIFNDTRGKGKNNLYNRIRSDLNVVENTTQSEKKGGTTRFEMDVIGNLPKNKNPNHIDYQINTDPASYDHKNKQNYATNGCAMQTSSNTLGAFNFKKQHPMQITKRDLLIPRT